MAKSNIKTLLVAFTTFRTIEGNKKRVRFSSGQTVDLTDAELEQLEALTKSTGKLHFRDPVNERVAVAEEPEVFGAGDEFEGQSVAIGLKTVPQLKAFLDFNEVAYAGNASKVDLVELANGVKADGGEGDGDPDSGL